MKTTLFSLTVLVALGLGLLTQSSRAQAPTGTITSPTFSGPTEGLYDLTGIITNIDEVFFTTKGEPFEFNQSIVVTQTASGALTGSGNTAVAVVVDGEANADYTAPYSVKGSVKSSGVNLTVALAFSAKGTDVALPGVGSDVTVTESIKYLLTIDPNAGTEDGHVSGTATASGKGSAKITDTTISGSIPAGLPVDWQLTLNLTSSGSKVTGSATVGLANDRSFPFTVAGTFSATTGTKLTLTGVEAGKGAKLTVTLTGNSITAITGKLLGQTISVSSAL